MIGKAGVWSAATASGAAALVVLAVAGWQFTHFSRPPSTSPAAAPENSSTPPAPKTAETNAPPESPTPRADIARVLPNGEVVVAGRTEPGGKVTLLDNDQPLMDMRADPATGEFVFLPPRLPPGPHHLSLRGDTIGGQAPESAVTAFTIAPPAAKAAPASPAVAAVAPREKPESPIPNGNRATIAKGDTLWRLSRERLGHGALYPSIFQANADKIRNPDRIYPGQSLTIP